MTGSPAKSSDVFNAIDSGQIFYDKNIISSLRRSGIAAFNIDLVEGYTQGTTRILVKNGDTEFYVVLNINIP